MLQKSKFGVQGWPKPPQWSQLAPKETPRDPKGIPKDSPKTPKGTSKDTPEEVQEPGTLNTSKSIVLLKQNHYF